MKNSLKTLCLLLLLVVTANACKDKHAEKEKADAILVWSGDYAADGCGFMVEIGNEMMRPSDEDAIPTKFKAAMRTPVTVEFVRLNEQIDRRCGLSPDSQAMPGIRILKVEKR